ncbi:copper resistance CopC family protein [Microbacterium sp.]|uniref:copper resistance CopC family protein n=1 Tax=Microbacterium sp. TaxID=51671 RepID=UPI002B709962|nr:copper resistance CopC family protein [Microbacterium sp.]HWL77632.1 copper resistance CopC family protein [Microbacterium sp.]
MIITRRVIAAGIALGLAVSLTSTSAGAHDALTDSSPRSGDVLASGPSEITLTFSDRVFEDSAVVAVSDSESRGWVFGSPAVDDATVTVQLERELPDGEYDVLWRVVSSDSHPISGAFTFRVGDGDTVDPASGAGDTESLTGPAQPAAVVLWTVVIAALAAVVAAVFLWRWVTSRRRNG